jgi:two-component system, chemotaxis family, chemotaxis protein CheY
MKNILIVDDSGTMRRMVAASLASIQETSFLEAATGLEALERLALTHIDLMILDMNMPDMHGLEVLDFLQRYPNYRSIPVIVLTTRGDEESREAALAAGAKLYLTKPFLPSALAIHARDLLSVPANA